MWTVTLDDKEYTAQDVAYVTALDANGTETTDYTDAHYFSLFLNSGQVVTASIEDIDFETEEKLMQAIDAM